MHSNIFLGVVLTSLVGAKTLDSRVTDLKFGGFASRRMAGQELVTLVLESGEELALNLEEHRGFKDVEDCGFESRFGDIPMAVTGCPGKDRHITVAGEGAWKLHGDTEMLEKLDLGHTHEQFEQHGEFGVDLGWADPDHMATILAQATLDPKNNTRSMGIDHRRLDAPSNDNLYITDFGLGFDGGDCTCPDGQVYQVALENNHVTGEKLACSNGVAGTINRFSGPWSQKRVVCAPADPTVFDQPIKQSPMGLQMHDRLAMTVRFHYDRHALEQWETDERVQREILSRFLHVRTLFRFHSIGREIDLDMFGPAEFIDDYYFNTIPDLNRYGAYLRSVEQCDEGNGIAFNHLLVGQNPQGNGGGGWGSLGTACHSGCANTQVSLIEGCTLCEASVMVHEMGHTLGGQHRADVEQLFCDRSVMFAGGWTWSQCDRDHFQAFYGGYLDLVGQDIADKCYRPQVAGLNAVSQGCSSIDDEATCLASKDGTVGEYFEGSPCAWCCGEACTPGGAKCEPTRWLEDLPRTTPGTFYHDTHRASEQFPLWTGHLRNAERDRCPAAHVDVVIGNSNGNSNTRTVTAEAGLVCPTFVNEDIWVSGDRFGDTFRITQDGNQVTAQRTDAPHGWGLNLVVRCYKGVPASCADVGYEFLGSELRAYVVDTAELCQGLCNRQEKCRAWSWEATTQRCSLKTSPSGALKRNRDTVFGLQSCLDAQAEGTLTEVPACSTIQTEGECLGSQDGSEVKYYSTSPCAWACGGQFSNGAKCESLEFVLGDLDNAFLSIANGEDRCPELARDVVVGPNSNGDDGIVLSSELGISCPTVVNRDNWVTADTFGDTFEVSRFGTRLVARRTDGGPGWGMHLTVRCFQAVPRCAQVGVDYSGNDIEIVNVIGTANECQTRCAKSEMCRAWTWKGDSFQCFLKSADTGRAFMSNAVSGLRTCSYQKTRDNERCEDYGMKPILDRTVCEDAAADIFSGNNAITASNAADKPAGCYESGTVIEFNQNLALTSDPASTADVQQYCRLPGTVENRVRCDDLGGLFCPAGEECRCHADCQGGFGPGDFGNDGHCSGGGARIRSSPADGGCYQFGFKFEPNDLVPAFTAGNLRDCHDRCVNTLGCGYYSFDNPAGEGPARCLLSPADAQPVTNQFWVGGAATCETPAQRIDFAGLTTCETGQGAQGQAQFPGPESTEVECALRCARTPDCVAIDHQDTTQAQDACRLYTTLRGARIGDDGGEGRRICSINNSLGSTQGIELPPLAPCPASHPYALQSGDNCCATAADNFGNNGVNGLPQRAFRSNVCQGGNSVACDLPPCMDHEDAVLTVPAPVPQVPADGCAVELYSEDGFRGYSVTFTENVIFLGSANLNDRVFSLKVIGSGCEAELSSDFNFGGRSAIFPEGSHDESDLIAANMIGASSLRVLEGAGVAPPNPTTPAPPTPDTPPAPASPTCVTGQGEFGQSFGRGGDATVEDCFERCSSTAECVAIDFAVGRPDSCRFYRSVANARIGDGGRDNRVFCEKAATVPTPPTTTDGVLGCGSTTACAYYYTGIGGVAVADLTGTAKFPGSPDDTRSMTELRTVEGYGDNYGVKVEAWVRPAATGDYVFSTRSDDASEVYLSITAGVIPANGVSDMTKVVEIDTCCRRERSTFTVRMEAGESYYLIGYMKEGGGGDYFEIGFELNGVDSFPLQQNQLGFANRRRKETKKAHILRRLMQ